MGPVGACLGGLGSLLEGLLSTKFLDLYSPQDHSPYTLCFGSKAITVSSWRYKLLKMRAHVPFVSGLRPSFWWRFADISDPALEYSQGS